MGGVREWIRRAQPARHEALPPEQVILGAVRQRMGSDHASLAMSPVARRIQPSIVVTGVPIRGVEDDRLAASLFVGSITELNSGSAPLATSLPSDGLPFGEDGMFVVDAESGRVLDTLPFVPTRTALRIDGAAPHKAGSRMFAGVKSEAITDTTSYSLRQAQLRMDELANVNRRQDDFLATLGHELRNPLAAIQNAVCLLRNQTQDSSAHPKTYAMIERQVHRMTELIDDLLEVSRITHGRLRLHCVRIDLREIVNNAIETLESDIHQRSHRLTTLLPDKPVYVQADPRRLEQVFVNLLANASKYTEAGGDLAISMHAQANQAVVRVRDSGVGIAAEVLPHIFDLFRQADEAAPCSQSGLGIGLALVRNFVDSHGGSVSAASVGIGHGSEFTVRLPATG